MTHHRDRRHIRDVRQNFLSGISVPEPKPFKPDEFQLRAIDSLAQGADTLVVAPTGTGKTFIAIEAIRHTILSGKRAIYTAPLKALSNTKYGEFKRTFEPEYRVGLLTGDRKIEGDANVVVATTEIYRNELFRIVENYSLVVLDEFHYLADVQRGPVWEESIILSPQSARLLMLSASISNAEQIAGWIRSIRGKPVNIISEKRRPVELRLGFLHPELGVIPLTDREDRVVREVSEVYRSGARFFGPKHGRGSGDKAHPGKPFRRKR